jgi:hypothetical protein
MHIKADILSEVFLKKDQIIFGRGLNHIPQQFSNQTTLNNTDTYSINVEYIHKVSRSHLFLSNDFVMVIAKRTKYLVNDKMKGDKYIGIVKHDNNHCWAQQHVDREMAVLVAN